MQGVRAGVDAVLGTGMHKAIPRVSPELVDRIPVKSFGCAKSFRSNWGLWRMNGERRRAGAVNQRRGFETRLVEPPIRHEKFFVHEGSRETRM